jgi:PTS system nitrogen regulatory IIA component
MDLNLKDVADLLNVSEMTIHDWLSEGKIPSYRINDQYRFSRVEIENWVLNHKLPLKQNEKSKFQPENQLDVGLQANPEHKTPIAKGGVKQFSLFRAIHKGGVIHNLQGNTKEELIRTAATNIATELGLDSEVISDILLDRESLQPTALNNGIGIPHPRDFLLNTTHDVVTIAFPETPIEYGALDGKPVHTLFFLFASKDKSHLHLLAKIAHFCSKKETIAFLNKHPSKKDLLDYVKDWESKIV